MASTEVLIPPPCFTCQTGCTRRSEGKRDETKRKDSGCHPATPTDRIVCLLLLVFFFVVVLLLLFLLLLLFVLVVVVVGCCLLVAAGYCCWCWITRDASLFSGVKKHAVSSNCKWDSDRIVSNTHVYFLMCLV